MFGFLGSGISIIGNAARNLFSGRTKKKRAALKAAKAELRDVKLQMKTEATRIEADRAQAIAMSARADVTKGKLMTLVKSYWWVVAIAAGLYFLIPIITGKKKSKAVRRRRKTAPKNSGSDFAARMKKARAAAERKRAAAERKRAKK